MLENIILIAVLIAIVALAAWYVIRAKKQGKKCIGCPAAGKCSSQCSCCSGHTDK